MSELRTKYQKWTQRRRRKWLVWWARERSKGQSRFVRKVAVIMPFAFIGSDFLLKILKRGFELGEFRTLPIKLLIYFGVALVFGWIAWRESERTYARYAPLELDRSQKRD